jgi:aspartate-semialdehyde dehydrogenase
MAAVYVNFERNPGAEKAKELMRAFKGEPQLLNLPTAPKQFLHVFEEDNRPQTALDRDLEMGMAVAVGRVRPDHLYDMKFVCLSHNTLRGAAGGALLGAELLAAKGWFER